MDTIKAILGGRNELSYFYSSIDEVYNLDLVKGLIWGIYVYCWSSEEPKIVQINSSDLGLIQ